MRCSQLFHAKSHLYIPNLNSVIHQIADSKRNSPVLVNSFVPSKTIAIWLTPGTDFGELFALVFHVERLSFGERSSDRSPSKCLHVTLQAYFLPCFHFRPASKQLGHTPSNDGASQTSQGALFRVLYRTTFYEATSSQDSLPCITLPNIL